MIDTSYPVPPEVGKVGKESPTFIQPVSERSDGIKSFFNKQSPAKSKGKAEPETTQSTGPKRSVKEEVKDEDKKEIKEEAKVDPEGIKSEITPKDEEKGLGDDSNAPNPSSDFEVVQSPDSKPEVHKDMEQDQVEENEQEEAEKEDLSTTLTKRKRDEKGGAGQRTKVIRRDDDTKSAVSTSFYVYCVLRLLWTLRSHRLGLSTTCKAEADDQQPSITNFFKSPGKPKNEEPPPRRASSRKKK